MKHDLDETKRGIQAKEFAIELLQQEMFLHEAKVLRSNKAFVQNARLFLSLLRNRDSAEIIDDKGVDPSNARAEVTK